MKHRFTRQRPFDPQRLRDLVASLVVLSSSGPRGVNDASIAADAFVLRAGRENLWNDVSVVFADELASSVAQAWQRGWQPADLAHVVGHRLQARHKRICTDAIGLQAQTYRHLPGADPQWIAQVEAVSDVGHSVSHPGLFMGWTHAFGGLAAGFLGAIETLALLQSLPPQPRLCIPPSEWPATAPPRANGAAGRGRTSTADPKMIERVRALLAKAESTNFPDEAEAFTAKAQELIARHAIDQALLGGDAGPGDTIGRRFLVDDPYGRAKSMLVDAIARANACSAVWSDHFGFCTVFGAPRDLDVVEILYASLLTQATAAMTAAGRNDRGRSRVRSFRQAFLVSFASRIGQRLQQATATAVDEARSAHGDSFLPVLASRELASEEARSDAFPDLRTRTVSLSNHDGWMAGRAAADTAHLGPAAALR
jgi:hypothetical protein